MDLHEQSNASKVANGLPAKPAVVMQVAHEVAIVARHDCDLEIRC